MNFVVALVWIAKEILQSPEFAVQIIVNLYPVRKIECISVQQGLKSHNLKKKSYKKKHTPWPLVRKRTIPTDRPPLVGKV
jgi:hypothetical protein